MKKEATGTYSVWKVRVSRGFYLYRGTNIFSKQLLLQFLLRKELSFPEAHRGELVGERLGLQGTVSVPGTTDTLMIEFPLTAADLAPLLDH